MKSVSNVQIEWRRQPKKHRFFVEFSGHGDRLTARNQFKKMLTFKRDKNGGKTSTLPVLPVLPVVTPAPTKEASTAPPKNMQKITVIHRNIRNKQLRCSRELRLSPREQNRLGKLLVKLESRYRVAITSSKLPNEWEIFVNSRTENDFSSVSASSSCIINHLNKCSWSAATRCISCRILDVFLVLTLDCGLIALYIEHITKWWDIAPQLINWTVIHSDLSLFFLPN